MIADLITVFIDNIGPIFIIIGIGWLVGRYIAIDARQLGRMLFNVFTPALVFRSLSTSEVSLSEFGLLFGLMAFLIVLLAVLAFLVAKLQGSDRIAWSGVILAAICPNDGNLGLPIVNFAFGPEVLARAVVVYIAATILNFTLGVYIASSGQNSPRQALGSIFKIPVVYAVAAGFIVNNLHITLPVPLERTVMLMSQATIPVMVLLLGVQLAQAGRIQHLKLVISGVVLRLIAAPIIAVLLASALNLQDAAFSAFVMQASMPVAVATTVLAAEFNLNREQVVGSVVASTLFSPITLSVLILILRGWGKG